MNMPQPIGKKIISIVTIVRNDLDGLLRTKNSLDIQSSQEFEWIIIDGNSDDETKPYVTTQLKNKNTIVVSEPDAGVYDAMNKGVSVATGCYIWFLNAGDQAQNEMVVEKCIEAIDIEHENVVYCGDYTLVASDGQNSNLKYWNPRKEIYTMTTSHQAQLIPASYLRKNQFDVELRIKGDFAIFMAYRRDGLEEKYLGFPVARFFLGGVSSNETFNNVREHFIVLNKYKPNRMFLNLFSCFFVLVAQLYRTIRY